MGKTIEETILEKKTGQGSDRPEEKKQDDKKDPKKDKKDGKEKQSISEFVRDDFDVGHVEVQSTPSNRDYETEQQLEKKEQQATIDYVTLKNNLERLSSYEELSKQYSLTSDQLQAVRDIYSQIREAEGSIERLGEGYHTMSEKIKEISDISKRIIGEISGSYIKDISEYRHTG